VGQHPFEEDKSMASTKLVAHQYVCIRALEAVLVRITEGFTPDVAYRVSSVNLTGRASQKEHKLRGKLIKFPLYVDGGTISETTFSCTIKLWNVLGLWHPNTMELHLGGQRYTATLMASMRNYNMVVLELKTKS